MVKVTKHYESSAPTEAELRASLEGEGFAPEAWSREAGENIDEQSVPKAKVIIVTKGMMRVTLPKSSEQYVDLMSGDRLEMPPGTSHGVLVGPAGVSCLEGVK